MSNHLSLNPVIRAMAAAFAALFVMSAVVFVAFEVLVGTFIGITFALIFLLFPAKRGSLKEHVTPVDYALVFASLGVAAYFIVSYEAVQRRAGFLTSAEEWIAATAIVVSIEAGRRCLGWPLPILGTFFFAYNYLGPHLPGNFGHPGFSFNRMMSSAFTGTGIFGMVASTYARYVVLFVVFGALMQAMGVVSAILDISMAATARFRAGPVKGAIVASGGIGSVVGQGVANIAITAPMTVPMMQRSGFSKERAGGLEVVSSIGGQLLPPVMGAGAFLVAQFAGVSYAAVVAAALAPALLLYISLLASAHFEAGVQEIGIISTIEREKFWQVMRRSYWALLPIAALMLLLFSGSSPFRSAFGAIAIALLINALRTRSLTTTVRHFYEGLYEGAFSMLPIASTAGIIGIVIAMINLPGLPITLAQQAFSYVRGSLLGAFFMVVLISLIIGMGMTITAAYVVVAVVAAPLLGEFGVPLLVAHLVVFWLSQDSSVTPPFALGAFVVAGITGGDVWKTAWHAFKYAKPLYIVPLLMLYSPLMSGDPLRVIVTTFTAAIGLIFAAAAFAGFYKAALGWPSRLSLGLAAGLTLWPDIRTSLAGVAAGVVLWLFQRQQNTRRSEYSDQLNPTTVNPLR